MFLLLIRVAGLAGDFSDVEAAGDRGTLVGKRSSSSCCQRMLGGLLIMLKRANLRIGERLREKGVCSDLLTR